MFLNNIAREAYIFVKSIMNNGDNGMHQKMRPYAKRHESKINCMKGVEKHEKEIMESMDRAHFGGNDVYGRPVFRLQS